ncbi:transglycosylase SLT domain-containing protein [Natronogracilivirga saccharolytica]|uniref:Transporter substrate-binding domain-containing protein n=1 Tax=Natronogracilivirga saccharolytica TaxID=2812953 RepID=A0A8J7UVX9_9BACT|nr:transporter substrate-binding domain-containing protein [Natronogracilivirga saccharolytica]MBP3193910.1 transporter substrate-binding domain-containing protein [Natronogracilivirga saccharolytica]
MRIRPKHIDTIGKSAGLGVLLLFATGVTSCGREDEHHEDVVEYSEPVAFDFEEIKERGTIRMITRYNSSSYFLHRGMDRGFDYELVSRFADKHDLKVEVVLLTSDDDPIELLNRGKGDIIAGNYAITGDRKPHVTFSKPYNFVNQVLVSSDLDEPVEDPEQLEGRTVSVRRNSSYFTTLQQLREQGLDVNIDVVSEDWNTEALMLEVAEGRMEATIADDNLYHVAANYIEGVQSGLVVSEQDTIAWAARQNAPELKEKMDDFIQEHFRIRESDGRVLRSAFLNILNRRYFEEQGHASRFENRRYDMVHTGYISAYDDLVKDIAADAGVDWKLVLAVMAQESRFDPNAKSWAGAIGLMQIIPRFSRVENEALLYDPEINIREGVRYLDKHLNRYAHLDSLNQYAFALASYNVGMGHIADARRLAVQLGNDPDEWENIADALLKLMNRKYYQHARYGFKRGIETVNYVEDVMNRYERYHAVASLAANFEDRNIPTLSDLGRTN